jgi:hypothetical protein
MAVALVTDRTSEVCVFNSAAGARNGRRSRRAKARQVCRPHRRSALIENPPRRPANSLTSVGLDIYAGSVTRYVAGDWLTIIEQAGAAGGPAVVVYRSNDADDAERDVGVITEVVGRWQADVLV